MGLPPAAGLRRHISITMEFASRTISPVPGDISRYVSEGLVSSVSPRVFPSPGGNAGGARSSQPVRKLLTPLPARYDRSVKFKFTDRT